MRGMVEKWRAVQSEINEIVWIVCFYYEFVALSKTTILSFDYAILVFTMTSGGGFEHQYALNVGTVAEQNKQSHINFAYRIY